MGIDASYDRTTTVVMVDESDRIWMFFAGNNGSGSTIFERHSDNGGSSWTSSTNVVSRDSSNVYDFEVFEIDSNRDGHLVYNITNSSPRIAKYQKWIHGSSSWSSKETCLSSATYHTYTTGGFIDSDDIPHIAGYQANSSGGRDVHYANRSGGSWSSSTRINDTSSSLFHDEPMIVFNTNDDFYFVWRDTSSPYKYYYKKNTGSFGSQTEWTPADSATVRGKVSCLGARCSGKDIPTQGFGAIWNRNDSGTYHCMWYGSDGLTFTLTKTLTETLTISDSIINNSEKVLSESLGISDSISFVSEMYRTLSETIQISDNVSYFKGMMTFLYESISISDSTTKDTTKVLSESLQVVDSISPALTIFKILSETINIVDNISYLKTIQIYLSETINISDSYSKIAQFQRQFDETLNIEDELPFPSEVISEYIKIMANLKKYKLRDFTLKIDPDASSILSGDLDEEMEDTQ